MNVDDKQFVKAKDYAYRLLSYRQRSTKEISVRLQKKGFTAQIISKTIKYLSALDYLNDENFAKSWIQTKMQSSPASWSLLRYQLRQKGVSGQVLEKVISDFASQYDEVTTAKNLANSRRRCYRGIEPLKLKKRLYDYLRRRGFSQETIFQAIGKEVS